MRHEKNIIQRAIGYRVLSVAKSFIIVDDGGRYRFVNGIFPDLKPDDYVIAYLNGEGEEDQWQRT